MGRFKIVVDWERDLFVLMNTYCNLDSAIVIELIRLVQKMFSGSFVRKCDIITNSSLKRRKLCFISTRSCWEENLAGHCGAHWARTWSDADYIMLEDKIVRRQLKTLTCSEETTAVAEHLDHL